MPISADLGKPLEEFVEELVKSGRYGSKSEVLREGIRLVQEREAKLAEFKAKIQEGVDAIERGDVYDLDEVFDELLARDAEDVA
ncbi:MAG: type II toxin-antitoxin system ParD family antitoxin [Pseudomonadota bacterium]